MRGLTTQCSGGLKAVDGAELQRLLATADLCRYKPLPPKISNVDRFIGMVGNAT
jgi:hypothetical protein